MQSKGFKALLLLAFAFGVNAAGRYRFGRMEGGNILPPPVGRVQSIAVEEQWFTQSVDHFNAQDTRTFQQKYFTNDEYFNSTGRSVAFLFLGGESAATTRWMTFGSWVQYGQEHGALLVQLEHRYYGDSHPTENISTENLRYLSSEQAIADAATLIVALNEKFNLTEDVQWIVFGGSYSGSLAAWLRVDYPYLVHGAVSSSGPILAKVDFHEYLGVVAESLEYFSPGCSAVVQAAFEATQTAIAQDADSQQRVNDLFNLCTPIQDSVGNQKDISNFLELLADSLFAYTVQYNLINGRELTITSVCDILLDESRGEPIDRLADVNTFISGNETCLDYSYAAMVDTYRDESWTGEGASSGYRQWTYQTCTEFGYFQTTSHTPQVFGDQFPISFFIGLCQDLFTEAFDSAFIDGAINRTNLIYGGLDIEVTNTVFVHGSIDPWHALGIYETRDPRAPAIYIEGAAHCSNMYESLPTDPPGLAAAVQQVGELITSWLQE